MARERIKDSVRREVLTEAGYRCAVPTCRGILALDLHHLVPVRDNGPSTASNLIALCPNCHALHERGTIPAEAIETYKGILVALMAAFDRGAIDLLLLLGHTDKDRRQLVMSGGNGVVPFAPLIGAGYADFSKRGADRYGIYYEVTLTERGTALLGAWKSGLRSEVEVALRMPSVEADPPSSAG